ncbi:tripartite tricarboxylate transporter substrate binding protein [Pseudorhodoferax sp. Leaf265]|uniref:Bug family tripartite tricarboxylate transporter substrate binding protein n=1 Tax=Pseudorhodoferax sp. Leaf265 TaxID=1736315 RepID=UPI0007013798|nr:tripartite tricarboxylate transporter substrate binding protein [Pseudorhodoferax sp. Leaf265]KQP03599.1 LacI family transcriptional regulator [Pseudorhodoferax sp. Leaf265]PZP91055.1 MAG: tripartite tricarboxylate transporter substrate binding protein [Variovorax paradoxus]PZQ00504.1 MAG: tripartite tricarboxylate transporter substrate binding protein [Variovorax paradoxus]
MFRRTFCSALAAGALAPGLALAQAYPSKPIRLIVPFPPGGGTDILSRLVAAKLTEVTKWTVVAENRAGAGGTVGIGEAVRGAPTGYDMVMGQKDNLVVGPWLYKNLPWDPTRDLVAVSHIAYTPVVIVTSSTSRFKTLGDVVAAARNAPDTITYGSPGNGTTIHLAGEIFKTAAGINIRHVPYKGSNPAMMDVLAGNVDLMVSSLPSAIGQLKSGKLRALAVTSAKRSSTAPEIPTVAELGYKDFDVSTWYGLFLPAATPKEIVATVHNEVDKLLAMPDMVAAVQAQGAEVQRMTAEQFSALVRSDYQKWKGIVEASGAKIE